MKNEDRRNHQLLRELSKTYTAPGWLLRLNLRFHLRRYWSIVRTRYVFVIKRGMDILFSGSLLLFFTVVVPLIPLLAWLIRRDGGPALFSQIRIGEGGKPFKFYKFRSMVPNAETLKSSLLEKNEMQGGVIFKMKDDPRITSLGRLLRKSSLDELPQLWNVLKGDMSLVGPRPPLPTEVLHYSALERQRLTAKQGITCLWQVSGRSDINFQGQVELDLRYIQDLSLRKDLDLLLRTIPAVITQKGAR